MARALLLASAVTAPTASRKILLVDDEEALAWSLASRLSKARPSDRIETANNGVDALASIERDAIDLLIADVRMPGMSGIDLVLAARAAHPDLPVIVMTAFKSADITQLGTEPFTGFLEKPFAFDKLRALVEDALRPPVVGFSGAINVQTLPDIVQLYALSNSTGLLQIRHGADEGWLYFANGNILHAATNDLKGEEAFFQVMM